MEGLSDDEKALYGVMGAEMREAMRVCGDLAAHHDNGGLFFLSCNDLAKRIGVTPPKAQRHLKGLCGLGILELVEKGTRLVKGMKGPRRASEWRYLKPLPAPAK